MKKGIATILCLISSFYFIFAAYGGGGIDAILIGSVFLLISIVYWVKEND
jgi:hypothetical protein